MTTDSYDLVELCDLADVTPRTVRYYVQQGLLPSPGSRGPGARYDRGHLDRLQLIRRLQHEHLPLAEIRSRLARLGDESVAELLDEPGPAKQHGSALEYVRDVLAGRPAHGTSAASAPQAARKGAMTARAIAPPPPPRVVAELPPDSRGAARSTWERVVLAEDVELHVRRPLSRAQNKQVERLIEHARTLFLDQS